MSNALYLFLSRVATTTLLIIAITMVGLDFPFDPAQVALTGFTVGLPAFFLMLWARPHRLDWDLLPSLARFVLPVAIVTMFFGVAIYVTEYHTVFNALPGVADTPSEWQQIYESYTGVTFGSEGYASIVAAVFQGTKSTHRPPLASSTTIRALDEARVYRKKSSMPSVSMTMPAVSMF